MGAEKQKLIRNKIEDLERCERQTYGSVQIRELCRPYWEVTIREYILSKQVGQKGSNVGDANEVGESNTLTLGLTPSGVSTKLLQTPEWKSIVCRNVLVPPPRPTLRPLPRTRPGAACPCLGRNRYRPPCNYCLHPPSFFVFGYGFCDMRTFCTRGYREAGPAEKNLVEKPSDNRRGGSTGVSSESQHMSQREYILQFIHTINILYIYISYSYQIYTIYTI